VRRETKYGTIEALLFELDASVSFRMLEENHRPQFDTFKAAYTDLLERWTFHSQKKSVEKFITNKPPEHGDLGKRFSFVLGCGLL